MHVIATAGHVDHGKSTLVRLLTGMEPDRWAEERRRGMTIDLGFAWTTTESGRTIAFVDVPGHERFVPNMLAGVGPVPAVLFVVAAGEGWKPQSAEHLDALRALRVRHGVLAITHADAADPSPAREQALAEIASTPLGKVETVVVSGLTGAGLEELRAALDRLVSALPEPDPTAPVRLWVDRVFSIRGAGTVVTGTLPAGTLSINDTVHIGRTAAAIRGLHTLGHPMSCVSGVARVAVNLRGLSRDSVSRGDALITPDSWFVTDLIDVRLDRPGDAPIPRELSFHMGSATVAARIRLLGKDYARIQVARTLPLHIGDRALLRDPGRRVILAGVTVVDVAPTPLNRRGAATARGRELTAPPTADTMLRRHRVMRIQQLHAMGLRLKTPPIVDDWVVDPAHWRYLFEQLPATVEHYLTDHRLEPGMPIEAARKALDLPTDSLVLALIRPPLVAADGRICPPAAELPTELAEAMTALRHDLVDNPYLAPESRRLTELGLGNRELAALVAAGHLLHVGAGIYLLPDADRRAIAILAGLPQPFTLSAARQALHTSRRVAVPLLELLDRKGRTKRLPDDRRVLSDPEAYPAW